MWDMLTLVGLGWESYLFLSDDSEDTIVNSKTFRSTFFPRLVLHTYPYGTQTVLLWNWRF